MPQTQLLDQIVITSSCKTGSNAIARANQVYFPCIVGHARIGQKRREGDGITPAGRWQMSYFLYRSDKILKPRSTLSGFAISPTDSWCDRASSHSYNQPLATVLSGSSEALWRSDELYDIIIILDHNTRPSVCGQGSAIFIHVSGSNNNHTHGCIAFNQSNLLKILARCGPYTCVLIK